MKKIPLYQNHETLNFIKLSKLPCSSLSHDFYQLPLPSAFNFCLALDSKNLFFLAQSDSVPSLDKNAQPKTFVEGLWNFDVAELFLWNENNTRYQEINLAPNAAWWSCDFEHYRQRTKNCRTLVGVEVFSKLEQDSWQAAISLPLSEISVDLQLNHGLRANVCAILGNKERRYLSTATSSAKKPDFHRTEDFIPFELIEI